MEYLYRYIRLPDWNSNNEEKDLKNTEKNTEKLKKLLLHNIIELWSPKEFNDPFACKVHFTFDGCDIRQEQIKHYRKAGEFSDKYKGVKPTEDVIVWKEKLLNRANQWLQSDIDENTGILCLCENCDNILMWSHYANGHKGICFQFNKKILEDKFYCKKVDYKDEYLLFSEFNEAFPRNNVELIKLLLLRKSCHWKYEKEWRIIEKIQLKEDEPVKRDFKFPEEMLTGIIFGCEANKETDKNYIYDLIKNRAHHVKIYEAKKKENSFGLDIIEKQNEQNEGQQPFK